MELSREQEKKLKEYLDPVIPTSLGMTGLNRAVRAVKRFLKEIDKEE